MATEITSAVRLAADLPGTQTPTEIGTITIPVHEGGMVELAEIRQALGDLLCEVGEYIRATGLMPEPSPSQGVGESESPG
ncbi:hypothetical protein AB0L49_02325 [Streptomyces antimycoticus]|uniref:hypothetical protein n=1 Tax=Streptomyces antimycoticus TaxID=68175 RepID=UPI003417B36A